ncbi:hypothetical protein [Halosegnis longus]|uniref:Uncharacterized protein n=1 Tax=Halosegnis longus TaxID=2216012 RepID=A0AAJ4RA72_9EURY|nr:MULTISPECIES: hypothetical protein [Halobacteriales]RNJ27421.1 hypothetical protein Nmn1133_12525 [Salella cibi]
MLRRLRATAPAGLVPLAWLFTLAAARGWISTRTVAIGLGVMATLLAVFAVLSAREMAHSRVLRAWLAVVVGGFFLTAAGLYAVTTAQPQVARFAVAGWMLLPAMGLVFTGRFDVPYARAHTLGGFLAGAGTVAFLAAADIAVLAGFAWEAVTSGGIVLVAVGQTAGILAATLGES